MATATEFNNWAIKNKFKELKGKLNKTITYKRKKYIIVGFDGKYLIVKINGKEMKILAKDVNKELDGFSK